jgi:hypothetical protein
MEIEKFKEFAALSKKKRELDFELDQVKEKLSILEPQILDSMAESGMDKITIDGMTLFIHSQLWAGVADGFTKPEAVAGLKAAGLSDLLEETYNTNKLSAYFRELKKDNDNIDLPVGISLTEKFSIRTRTS